MNTAEMPIGQRVALWRTRRRMTQGHLAAQLGKSKSWVDKVERGVRRLDRISVVREIAEALDVDPALLTDGGQPPGTAAPRRGRVAAEVDLVRATLERYDGLHAWLAAPDEASGPAPDLAELRIAVEHAWSTFQRGRLLAVLRTLPGLVAATRTAAGHYDHGPGAFAGARLVTEALQLCSSTLRHLGALDLAWMAADRAARESPRTGDELLVGLAAAGAALAMVEMGRARPALELATAVATGLRPRSGEGAGRAHASVYGVLLLQGAVAAGRLGDRATVVELLAEAAGVARRVGDADEYHTSFGPTSVRMHAVRAWVDLGEPRRAVREAEQVPTRSMRWITQERRVHHWLHLARAHVACGDGAEAVAALVAAERVTPGDLAARPLARAMAVDLARMRRDVPPQVALLATAGV